MGISEGAVKFRFLRRQQRRAQLPPRERRHHAPADAGRRILAQRRHRRLGLVGLPGGAYADSDHVDDDPSVVTRLLCI